MPIPPFRDIIVTMLDPSTPDRVREMPWPQPSPNHERCRFCPKTHHIRHIFDTGAASSFGASILTTNWHFVAIVQTRLPYVTPARYELQSFLRRRSVLEAACIAGYINLFIPRRSMTSSRRPHAHDFPQPSLCSVGLVAKALCATTEYRMLGVI